MLPFIHGMCYVFQLKNKWRREREREREGTGTKSVCKFRWMERNLVALFMRVMPFIQQQQIQNHWNENQLKFTIFIQIQNKRKEKEIQNVSWHKREGARTLQYTDTLCILWLCECFLYEVQLFPCAHMHKHTEEESEREREQMGRVILFYFIPLGIAYVLGIVFMRKHIAYASTVCVCVHSFIHQMMMLIRGNTIQFELLFIWFIDYRVIVPWNMYL